MPDGMARPMLPAVEKFVVAMRKIFEDGVPEPDRWELCREHLKEVIADPDVKVHAEDWPITGFNPETNRVQNLLFYEDPDYGFETSESHAEYCEQGDVDVVKPWLIHSEFAGDKKSIAVIVRSKRSGTFKQYRYLEDGSRVVIKGPEQVPYELA